MTNISCPTDQPDKLFYSAYVAQLSELLITHADRVLLQTTDLTFSQFKLLYILNYHDSLSQEALAQCLAISPAAISRLSETLATKKYIQRTSDPQNRRKNIVQLTKAGRELTTKTISTLEQLEKELYHQLPQPQLDAFLATAKQLITTLIAKQSKI